MGAMASQITSLTIVYSTVYSGADQRKHQSSAPLALVWGIHRWPVNSPRKWPVTPKMFPFDDVIMFVAFWFWLCLSISLNTLVQFCDCCFVCIIVFYCILLWWDSSLIYHLFSFDILFIFFWYIVYFLLIYCLLSSRWVQTAPSQEATRKQEVSRILESEVKIMGLKSAVSVRNWFNSQIPECNCSISHNVPFRTDIRAFLFWMEHCGMWNRCILGFVKLV